MVKYMAWAELEVDDVSQKCIVRKMCDTLEEGEKELDNMIGQYEHGSYPSFINGGVSDFYIIPKETWANLKETGWNPEYTARTIILRDAKGIRLLTEHKNFEII